MFGYVERFCVKGLGLTLQFIQEFSGSFNVFGLRGFVSTGQQEKYSALLDGVVNSQAAAKEKAQFKQVRANLFKISEIAVFYPVKPSQDLYFY